MAQIDDIDQRIHSSLNVLRAANVVLKHGLSDSEVNRTEQRFGFRFPLDLKAFLQLALPIAAQPPHRKSVFPNWRAGDETDLQQRLDWPFDGMKFDIEHNVFWMDEWGPKPSQMEDAIAVARSCVAATPKLIPVFSHRYLPSQPHLAGNPVFSVHQTDIIIYGRDLWDYFEQEFDPRVKQSRRSQSASRAGRSVVPRSIPFWSKLTE